MDSTPQNLPGTALKIILNDITFPSLCVAKHHIKPIEIEKYGDCFISKGRGRRSVCVVRKGMTRSEFLTELSKFSKDYSNEELNKFMAEEYGTLRYLGKIFIKDIIPGYIPEVLKNIKREYNVDFDIDMYSKRVNSLTEKENDNIRENN